MRIFVKKMQKNLVISKKSSTFAPAFQKKGMGRSPWGPRKFRIFGESAAHYVALYKRGTRSRASSSASEVP